MARRILTALLTLLAATAQAVDQAPYGLESRVAWTTSRLIGSPDPPLPYTVEKTFAGIDWKSPMYMVDEPGTDRLLVVLQGGNAERPSKIVRFADDPAANETELFFELPNRLIYALCFHPDYKANDQVFLFTNGPTSEPQRINRVSRFRVRRGQPPTIDAASEQPIIEWPSAGHDGGDLAFGPDRMLYITTGDGTSDSDTLNSGQTLDDLLGSVLRIDVDHRNGNLPYTVPANNPFVNTKDARGEIWAYGLRNPWRMAIDATSGQVWVGNNGQDQWETAHLVHAGDNYGWSVYEGSHPFYPGRRRGPTPLVLPTIEHSHAEFRSLTGGVVYRGAKHRDLDGAYVYGDYSSGRIWGMKHDGKRPLWHRELADTALQIAAFGVDQRGELLVVDHGGGLYRLLPAPTDRQTTEFPARLSETGLFTDVKDQRLAAGVIPYSVNVPGWADGAHGERAMAVPAHSTIEYDSGKSWGFADGTALVQTLSVEREAGNAASRFPIETRVLLRQQGEWAGYSYRWNDERSDAVLVAREGEEIATPRGPWRFPSRTDCMVCHSRAASYVLGLTEAQLNRDHDYPLARDNQLRTLAHIGMFSRDLPKPPDELAKLADPHDASADLEARARSYLHVNCSVCHVSAGGGNAQMELALATAREKMNLLGARPQHDTFGITNAMLVAPGDPARSVLVERLSRRGTGQMPPVATRQVDQQAVKLMRDWIATLKADRPIVKQWQIDDLAPVLDRVTMGRSPAAGQTAFRETGCIQCHRFGTEGGNVGPDLTGVAKRLKPRELVESILLPSKVIADEYASYAVETSEGRVVSGQIEREDEKVLVLRPPSASEQPIEVAKADIVERRRLDRSNMPNGTVDVLKLEEVLDLLAYLLGDAKPQAVGGR